MTRKSSGECVEEKEGWCCISIMPSLNQVWTYRWDHSTLACVYYIFNIGHIRKVGKRWEACPCFQRTWTVGAYNATTLPRMCLLECCREVFVVLNGEGNNRQVKNEYSITAGIGPGLFKAWRRRPSVWAYRRAINYFEHISLVNSSFRYIDQMVGGSSWSLSSGWR